MDNTTLLTYLLEKQTSCCPALLLQIYGLYIVKLATALMVVGGVPRFDEAGTHIRGEIHMLLIGDPGTGAPPCPQGIRPGLGVERAPADLACGQGVGPRPDGNSIAAVVSV